MTTLKQIAEMANVSIGTVDRVVHNRGRVSQETSDKVKKIITDLGYKPNQFARNLKLNRTFHVGIIMPFEHQDGGYWEKQANGMRKALEVFKINQFKGDFYYFDKYAESVLDHIVSADLNKLDGLLAAPVLARSFTRFFQRWPGNKPYVFFDTDLPGTGPLAVINQDAFQSGRLAAELILKSARHNGPILVFKPIPDDYHICARIRGFTELIESEGQYPVFIHELDTGLDACTSEPLILKIIRQHPHVEGIFVPNAAIFQVASALSDFSFHSKPVLIGYDLIGPNADWLKRGTIDYIISQRPEMQGYQGVYALYRHLVLNETVESRLLMPLDIITRENMHFNTTF